MNEPRDRPGGDAWVSLDIPHKTKEQIHEISKIYCRAARRFIARRADRMQKLHASASLDSHHTGGLRAWAEQSKDHRHHASGLAGSLRNSQGPELNG